MTTAEIIAKKFNGYKSGKGWMVHCPAHDDKDPSLSVEDKGGTLLFYCHAGCSQEEVMAALKKHGLWDPDDKAAHALEIWESAVPAENTLVETYLASRNLNMPVPSSLRFHPRLKHDEGEFPGMVALITRGEAATPIAIHRTFLDKDGRKTAPIRDPKMTLGSYKGGAIRLGNPDTELIVGRSIEKCLAAMQARGVPAWAYWRSSPQTLELPVGVKKAFVLNDLDDGRNRWAARNLAQSWKRRGISVSFEKKEELDPRSVAVRRRLPANQ